ncbi:MAG: signal recognition particle-docking protein FtsY [Planctomycetota bacterium]
MALWNPFGKKKTTPARADEKSASEESRIERSEAAGGSDLSKAGEPAKASEGDGGNTGDGKTESEKPAPKRSMFGFIKQALKKTVDSLNTDIRDLFGKEGRLVDDEFLDELYRHLVKTDMGVGPAGKIRDSIRSQFRGRKVMMSDLIDSARETIREIMEQEASGIQWATTGPTVIMVVGVNGSGKTTSIAKLTYRFVSEGKSVVLGAGDTFRAAAVEQLGIWAERLGAKIVTGKAGSDPASVAYKAVEAGLKDQVDVVIVDTAGRLQTQANLMDELSRIRRVIGKLVPEAPHEVLLVLDATAGQNAISQAKGFSQAAGCTGIVLAKLDGTAKGGVAIPIRQEFGLPVKFIGLGETPEAFADFNVEQYVSALFDVED